MCTVTTNATINLFQILIVNPLLFCFCIHIKVPHSFWSNTHILPGEKNSTTTTEQHNTNVYSHIKYYNQPVSNLNCSSSSVLLLYSYKKYPIIFGAKFIEIEIRLPGAKTTTTTKTHKCLQPHKCHNQPYSFYINI
jgi:hypothetical protein